VDPLSLFKQAQKQIWSNFGPVEVSTTPVAGRLVQFADVKAGVRVLDAGCGTGVVAVSAARMGAQVSGIDITAKLLERARENASIAGVDIDWQEADVEELPFPDAHFDIVLSQFAHMFAPRPSVAVGEMLRVLKPGGSIAFCTWPPELLVGSTLSLALSYLPAPPVVVADPMLWGDPAVVRQRLGDAVSNLVFDRGCMQVYALSPQHLRFTIERTVGPVLKVVEMLSTSDPERLKVFRSQFDAIASAYFANNIVRQDYLLTRAIKK
jgi:SAM-dependent methyltransferase